VQNGFFDEVVENECGGEFIDTRQKVRRGVIFRNQIGDLSTSINITSDNSIQMGLATRVSDQKPPETW